MKEEGTIIAVDLDGTLAYWDDLYLGTGEIGGPVQYMVDTIKSILAEEEDVEFVIYTSRLAGQPPEIAAEETEKIQNWCERHGLPRFSVTATKYAHFSQFWDDKAVTIIRNQGIPNDLITKMALTEALFVVIAVMGGLPEELAQKAHMAGIDLNQIVAHVDEMSKMESAQNKGGNSGGHIILP